MDMSLFRPYKYDYDRVEKYIKRQKEKKRLAFAIMRNGSPVGKILLNGIFEKEKACTLSIHLQNDAVKGLGIGTKAEQMILQYAFRELAMKTVCADCVLKNAGSRHVLEKVGFKRIHSDEMFIYYKAESSLY